MTDPQARFFMMQAKYPAFIGGFGTGKTETLANCAIADALDSSTALVAMYEPTFDLVRLILAPRMQDKLSEIGIRYKYNKQENIIYTSSGQCGDFVMRTLDNPARIIGYESYRAHVDELDTLKPAHAAEAWRKIIARNRQRPAGISSPFNRVRVYTTPEGFRFVYDTWARDPKPGYEMVQAATQSNPFLPEDYVESLRASYPSQLIDAYLEGRFVNLTSGTIYSNFDRRLNHSDAEAKPGEPLIIGMDFNVQKMAAVVYVIRDGCPIAVDEMVDIADTPAMADMIKRRFAGHAITICPDASGQNTSSKNASESDLSILRAAGFTLKVTGSNPSVRDRILSTQAMLLNGKGERRMRVNTHRCPKFTEGLEQQVYDNNGEPDKTNGIDHVNDAGTYPIVRLFPIVKRTATAESLPI
jgi:hypothetical protein